MGKWRQKWRRRIDKLAGWTDEDERELQEYMDKFMEEHKEEIDNYNRKMREERRKNPLSFGL
jgi:hypothetical protein